METVNKKFKNSVFSFVFSNPDVLRELYCALEGIPLKPDVPVVINTLEDILFMDMINDISFETVQYCKKNDILKELIEKHAKEIMSMLTTEWNWDTAKRVWQDEAREEGLSQGREEIARNALEEGASVDFVQKITGLNVDVIEQLMR